MLENKLGITSAPELAEAEEKISKKKAIELFSGLECNVKVLKVPDGKDPDEFIKKHGSIAFEKLLSSARATTRYEIDSLMSKYDLSDISQKVEFSREVTLLLSKLKSAVEQDEYIKYTCLKSGISEDALVAEIKKNRNRQAHKAVTGEMKKAVAISPNSPKPGYARLKKAEAGLLCALLTSKPDFEKLTDKVSEDMFTYPLHKEIFSKAKELYSSGNAFGITELSAFFTGREGEFSEVFLTGDEISDSRQAACDYIKVIEAESLKLQIEEATKTGNVELLSQLLRKQKSLKG